MRLVEILQGDLYGQLRTRDEVGRVKLRRHGGELDSAQNDSSVEGDLSLLSSSQNFWS
jgi:hypothetical protein